jgi:hypothetical protein
MNVFFALVVLISIVFLFVYIQTKKWDLDRKIQDLSKVKEVHERTISSLNKEIKELNKGIYLKDQLYESLKIEDKNTFTRISSLFADFLLVQFDISSRYLKSKSHPAFKEAARIDKLKAETGAYIQQYRQMFYKYEYLLQIFPELSEYVDDLETMKQLDNIEGLKSLEEDFDRTQFYLSKEEFRALSINERNQRALDRYVIGQKSKWQIGRDYELYCGIEYEKKGWQVEYFGMEKKLEDMGRDLVAINRNEHHVIQCKYWAKDKLIHEKHISQLFGSTVVYGLDLPPQVKVTPVFITNIELSLTAKRFAEKLGVVTIEKYPLKDFPRIKCNVNKDEFGCESKIYHLPFDQQYDKTKISKKNEFYAMTVEEAVNAGFRRAFKYFGG